MLKWHRLFYFNEELFINSGPALIQVIKLHYYLDLEVRIILIYVQNYVSLAAVTKMINLNILISSIMLVYMAYITHHSIILLYNIYTQYITYSIICHDYILYCKTL